jgi:hypothetical protein
MSFRAAVVPLVSANKSTRSAAIRAFVFPFFSRST